MKNIIILTWCLISHPLWSQVSFEGEGKKVDSLNTRNGQNFLTLHPDQSLMAFTEEKGGRSDSEALFGQQKIAIDSQEWEVRVFTDWLVEKGMLSPLGFSNEGMYVNQVTYEKGMYYGKVLLRGSSELTEVEIPYFRNKSPIQSGCISQDGQYMILSLESNNTYGVEDLYVSKRKPDGTWGQAKNLGYQLNTEFQEITPFLSEDNRTLFFATNGRGGAGSFDLFATVRLDESWRSWSEPINLGEQVNTSGAETSFAYQDGGNWAYYVSSQDSDGYGDIMRIRMSEAIVADSAAAILPQTDPERGKEEVNENRMIQVITSEGEQAIPATLIAPDLRREEPNGLFAVDSLVGQEVEIKSPGYLPKLVVIDERLSEGINRVALSSIKKGNVITLENVLFQRGTAIMIAGSQKELNLVVEVMQDNPDIQIMIKGHTDNTGDPVKNVRLSEARVKTVKEYILSQGISPFRVAGKGFGGNEPVASNETEETRKLNRRVEFEVVKE